ncbi:hypothetical protein [Paenibacillus sophorae]|uniref:Uncharacterized protein n=1 Tax=Paenibacillus sophorae TaxID=1333845 RepID=A0ABX8H874_9BACL|nr:hypothetical protein [Paenibacillus sophorae]QWU14455.1 hypothetical protein KP014_21340 [Paenibacillus sophorae]
MDIQCGNGLWLKCFFANGNECGYPRPFLVISCNETTGTIQLLNVSSVLGKERKLLMDSNLQIMRHNPPFPDASFVKLDEVYGLDYFPKLINSIKNQNLLLEDELNKITEEFRSYKATNTVLKVSFSYQDLISRNNKLR